MPVDVDVANAALSLLGETPLVALTDETANARLINARYNSVRRSVLRMHAWNAATRRAALAQLVGTPASEWDFAYALPTDFIRVVEPRTDADVLLRFSIELHPSGQPSGALTRALLCDFGAVVLRYVADQETTSLLDPLLFNVTAHALALDISNKITGKNASIVADIKDRFRTLMSEARFEDAAEVSVSDLFIDVWEHARRTGQTDEIPDFMLLST